MTKRTVPGPPAPGRHAASGPGPRTIAVPGTAGPPGVNGASGTSGSVASVGVNGASGAAGTTPSPGGHGAAGSSGPEDAPSDPPDPGGGTAGTDRDGPPARQPGGSLVPANRRRSGSTPARPTRVRTTRIRTTRVRPTRIRPTVAARLASARARRGGMRDSGRHGRPRPTRFGRREPAAGAVGSRRGAGTPRASRAAPHLRTPCPSRPPHPSPSPLTSPLRGPVATAPAPGRAARRAPRARPSLTVRIRPSLRMDTEGRVPPNRKPFTCVCRYGTGSGPSTQSTRAVTSRHPSRTPAVTGVCP